MNEPINVQQGMSNDEFKLENVQFIDGLKKLSLAASVIKRKDLEALAGPSDLEELDLSSCEFVTGKGFMYFKKMRSLKKS